VGLYTLYFIFTSDSFMIQCTHPDTCLMATLQRTRTTFFPSSFPCPLFLFIYNSQQNTYSGTLPQFPLTLLLGVGALIVTTDTRVHSNQVTARVRIKPFDWTFGSSLHLHLHKGLEWCRVASGAAPLRRARPPLLLRQIHPASNMPSLSVRVTIASASRCAVNTHIGGSES
jgi:hypothetical protein